MADTEQIFDEELREAATVQWLKIKATMPQISPHDEKMLYCGFYLGFVHGGNYGVKKGIDAAVDVDGEIADQLNKADSP